MSKRETLLDIGEDLIRRRGFAGFSYADLAKAAGIQKASVHHHFPTKADFGLAVLDRYSGRHLAALNELSSCRTGGLALHNAIELYRQAVGGGDQLCLCVALSGDRELLSDDVRQALANTNAKTAQWIESVLLAGRRDRSISVGGDPSEEAIAILAQLQGAQLIARAARDPALFNLALSTLSARIHRH